MPTAQRRRMTGQRAGRLTGTVTAARAPLAITAGAARAPPRPPCPSPPTPHARLPQTQDNMIDRFDGRSLLDFYRDPPPHIKKRERTAQEQRLEEVPGRGCGLGGRRGKVPRTGAVAAGGGRS
jgi:hypothetical protein